MATCFGPKTQNFRDIVELLLTNHAANVVHTRDELLAFVRQMAESPQERKELGQRAAQVVAKQRGAAEKTVQMLSTLLQGGRNSRRNAA